MKKQNQPLVSVLIPVYNGTEFLDEAIQSVLASTYQNIEVILVDDGSSDASVKKCKAYEQKYKHVRFFGFKKNKGMTRCLNYGVKKAHGEFIARLNQDDIMHPERITKQVSFLLSHPEHVIVGGKIQLFTNDNPKFDTISFPSSDKKIRKQWMFLSPFSDPTVMYRKSAWLQTEGYSQYFWPADDVHMWYQLGKIGKLANLNSVLTKVRWHEDCGSLKSHRRQMIKTWQVHNWAAECIQQPTLAQYVFWINQLLAGYLFPPKFNWWVYRQLRKIQQHVMKAHKHVSLHVSKGKELTSKIAVARS
jgi:glycosyltransferase involved in cell wall biosynthesis